MAVQGRAWYKAMRKKGKIRSWNEQKAYGFIQPNGGGKDVFLHISGMKNRNRTPQVGQDISFILASDKQGRPCAAEALLPGERLPKANTGLAGAFVISTLSLCAVAFLAYATSLPGFVFWLYLVVSLATFFVYAADKAAARGDSRRTPENTLHLLALAGGWPGALIAQQALRHKSRKQPFRTVFWATVVINCAALLWLCTPDGNKLLRDWGVGNYEARSPAMIAWAD